MSDDPTSYYTLGTVTGLLFGAWLGVLFGMVADAWKKRAPPRK